MARHLVCKQCIALWLKNTKQQPPTCKQDNTYQSKYRWRKIMYTDKGEHCKQGSRQLFCVTNS